MRVVFAGVFVFAIVLGVVILLSEVRSFDTFSPAVVGICIGCLLVGLCVCALVLFNRRCAGMLGSKSAGEQIREWDEQNALVAVEFSATRAFEIEEFEDEGMHYFIELTDGGVLYLNGQYLYDYEEITDDSEIKQPRRFPCSEFTVRRHRTDGFVVDIQCRGAVLQPEIVAPHFSPTDFEHGRVPEDGTVIHDRTYTELKSHFSRNRPNRTPRPAA